MSDLTVNKKSIMLLDVHDDVHMIDVEPIQYVPHPLQRTGKLNLLC